MLYQFRPQTAFLFGHRFAYAQDLQMEEGYMAGSLIATLDIIT